jgi:hypothetical protein
VILILVTSLNVVKITERVLTLPSIILSCWVFVLILQRNSTYNLLRRSASLLSDSRSFVSINGWLYHNIFILSEIYIPPTDLIREHQFLYRLQSPHISIYLSRVCDLFGESDVQTKVHAVCPWYSTICMCPLYLRERNPIYFNSVIS